MTQAPPIGHALQVERTGPDHAREGVPWSTIRPTVALGPS